MKAKEESLRITKIIQIHVTTLLDSQSFPKMWKSAEEQTFCAIALMTIQHYVKNTFFLLIRPISLQTLSKIEHVILCKKDSCVNCR